jgi:riboflavin biosynthesis pyrimidine reductase
LTFKGFDLLFEDETLPRGDLTDRLRDLYGGDMGFNRPALIANFVSSVDGVAALPEIKDSPAVISGGSEADRFVMGLLRALSDAVVIGAGTMRNAEGHLWTPDYIYPDLQADYLGLRRDLGLQEQPSLVVVTAKGDLPESHPGLERGAIIVTVEQTASKLAKRLPESCEVVALGGESEIAPQQLHEFLESREFQIVLCEAGPALFTQLLDAGFVDELFLTYSPFLAGRDKEERPGIVSGTTFLPGRKLTGRLLSVRRSDSHLFLRYRLS